MKTTTNYDYIHCPSCEGEGEVHAETVYHRGNHQDEGCIDREVYEDCSFCDGESQIPVPVGTTPHEDAVSESRDWRELLDNMEDCGAETHAEECECEDSACLSLRNS